MNYIQKLMNENGIKSTDKSGCVACGMCDLIGNKKIFKNDNTSYSHYFGRYH